VDREVGALREDPLGALARDLGIALRIADDAEGRLVRNLPKAGIRV
jgi:hypothetical protein